MYFSVFLGLSIQDLSNEMRYAKTTIDTSFNYFNKNILNDLNSLLTQNQTCEDDFSVMLDNKG